MFFQIKPDILHVIKTVLLIKKSVVLNTFDTVVYRSKNLLVHVHAHVHVHVNVGVHVHVGVYTHVHVGVHVHM